MARQVEPLEFYRKIKNSNTKIFVDTNFHAQHFFSNRCGYFCDPNDHPICTPRHSTYRPLWSTISNFWQLNFKKRISSNPRYHSKQLLPLSQNLEITNAWEVLHLQDSEKRIISSNPSHPEKILQQVEILWPLKLSLSCMKTQAVTHFGFRRSREVRSSRTDFTAKMFEKTISAYFATAVFDRSEISWEAGIYSRLKLAKFSCNNYRQIFLCAFCKL